MTDKETAFEWFKLGFAQSSDGYNAEYAGSHLAPSSPREFGMEGNRYIYDEPPEELEDLFEQLWEEGER